jgi:hypothetical protein
MRSIPDDENKEELEELKAEGWMVEMLSLNPEYTFWGPHEDYMYKRGDGWDSPVCNNSWKEFELTLDELNECVNFYFEVDRQSEGCKACGQEGYNPETRKIANEFYDTQYSFMGSSKKSTKRWCDKITVDEAQALVDAERLYDFTHTYVKGEGWIKKDPPVVVDEEFTTKVNAWQAGHGMGHDAINRSILVKTRAKRLGVYGFCPECEGQGHIYTSPTATLTLVLWILHPHKGCSRGWEIKNLKKEDVPAILKFLREAAERNFERFQKAIEFSGAFPK